MAVTRSLGETGRIENLPLRTVFADMLRKAIITGRMKPGMPIVEMTLAEQLNASRAPIREAIQVLENEGLIETTPYRGKRVKPLTARDVEEVTSLCQQFESFAIGRIVETGTDPAPLEAACGTMRIAADAGNSEAVMEAHDAFHRKLILMSDHALLLSFWDNLSPRIRQILGLHSHDERDLHRIAANHPPIVSAIRAADIETAIRLAAAHTRYVAEIRPKPEAVAP